MTTNKNIFITTRKEEKETIDFVKFRLLSFLFTSVKAKKKEKKKK